MQRLPQKGKVKLNATKLTLYVGETFNLKVTGTKQKVKWSSSNKEVVTVNKKGKVSAKGKGKATITAKVGNKKYKCNVTVKEITSKTVFGNGCLLTSINTLQFSTKEIRKLSNGDYQVDAYIYNGLNYPVGDINVTSMTLYDRSGNQVASAAFGVCKNLVINQKSYAIWTFHFDKEYVNDGDFDLSKHSLHVYSNFIY